MSVENKHQITLKCRKCMTGSIVVTVDPGDLAQSRTALLIDPLCADCTNAFNEWALEKVRDMLLTPRRWTRVCNVVPVPTDVLKVYPRTGHRASDRIIYRIIVRDEACSIHELEIRMWDKSNGETELNKGEEIELLEQPAGAVQ